jgi:hypothetical protein
VVRGRSRLRFTRRDEIAKARAAGLRAKVASPKMTANLVFFRVRKNPRLEVQRCLHELNPVFGSAVIILSMHQGYLFWNRQRTIALEAH